jgi:hypothetical protein
VSGRQAIEAVAAGFELQGRLHRAAFSSVKRWLRGLHVPGSVGPFGSVAACAKLLESSPRGLQMAFGIAGSRVSGLMANTGTMSKATHSANAALLVRADPDVSVDQARRRRVEVGADNESARPGRPASGLAGKFSVAYTVAIALLDGAVTIDSFRGGVVTRHGGAGEWPRTVGARRPSGRHLGQPHLLGAVGGKVPYVRPPMSLRVPDVADPHPNCGLRIARRRCQLVRLCNEATWIIT